MAQNPSCPWIVECLEDFLYYCCPECNNRHQTRDKFLQHAQYNNMYYYLPNMMCNVYTECKKSLKFSQNIPVSSCTFVTTMS